MRDSIISSADDVMDDNCLKVPPGAHQGPVSIFICPFLGNPPSFLGLDMVETSFNLVQQARSLGFAIRHLGLSRL